MPRHNYPAARERVMELCSKHGISHHTTTFWQGVSEVTECLRVAGTFADGKAEKGN